MKVIMNEALIYHRYKTVMKHIFTILSLLILIPFFSSAQSNYKSGYVVTLKGDTLQGFINYKEWEKNPTEISFKNNLNAAAGENFTIVNARAFGIKGLEYFEQYTVNISQGQVAMANIKQGVDTSYITGKVFLRVVTKGPKVQLYAYTDNIKTRYYIAETAENKPIELTYQIYYSPENVTVLKTQNRFRYQLAYFAQKYNANNNALQRKITDAEYNEDDLLKVVRVINGDLGKQQTPKGSVGTEWFAGVGVTDNIFYFTGAIQYANSSSIYPAISGGMNIYLNKNTEALFFRAEVSLTENNHSFNGPEDASGSSFSMSNVIQRNVSVSPQVGYNIYNTDRFKWFVMAGPSINISSYNKYYTTQNLHNVLSVVSNQFPDLYTRWVSFAAKTGVTLNKHIQLYAGSVFQTTVTDDYALFAGRMITYEAGINYLFGVK